MGASFQQPFTDAQIELLGLFKLDLKDSDMKELREVLLEFKFRKLQEKVEQLSDEKGYTDNDFMAMGNEHNRTPYKNFHKHLKSKSL